ncbi:MAG: cytochrome P450 [Burkholderiales bacterium]
MEVPAVRASRETAPVARALLDLDDLPGPAGLPLLGNALQIEPKRLHRILSGWAEKFGPMFVFRVGQTRFLTVVDAQTIQQILRDRPDTFRRWSKIQKISDEIATDGLFSAEGSDWRRQRTLVMHALNTNHVRAFVPRLEEVVGRLRRRWWRSAVKGTAVDVTRDLMKFTVDVTTGLAFGKDLNTTEDQTDPIQKHLDQLFMALARRQTALFPYWRYIQLPADRKTKIAVKEVSQVISELIALARVRTAHSPELRAKPGNLLEAMVAAQETSAGAITDKEIASNVMTLLLAGEDTTANTLSWMIHFMMEHPSVQAGVQEEVDRLLASGEHSWADPAIADSLVYTDAVAKEAMRCKPVGGQLFLEANHDTEIGGVRVPKGTPVLALSGDVGLQEENFARASDFLPERWLERQERGATAHNTKAFMPFGAGPRFCPGRHLAMLQIKMVIAMLCRDFEFSRPANAPPVEDVYAIVVGPTSVLATLRPRRALRMGTDIELRLRDRRTAARPLVFPDRRVGQRRQRAQAVLPNS